MDYGVYVLVCLAAVVAPGPAVLSAVKNALTEGMKGALVGIAGNISAMLLLAMLSASGLSALLLASDTLFQGVKFVGGAYLIYLGFCSLKRAQKPEHGLVETTNTAKVHTQFRRLYIQAFVVGVSNPKAIAFYAALFPQFIDVSQPLGPQLSVLATTFALCSCIVLAGYALLARHFRHYLLRPKISQRFHQITGGIFIGFGSSLLLTLR